MSARDELADLLMKHEDCAFSASGLLVCSCGVAVQPQEVMDDMANLAGHQADILTAAGYRRARTITTAEELDALPVGSVIMMTGVRAPFMHTELGWESTRTPGKPVYDYVQAPNHLPATVLYEPEQP